MTSKDCRRINRSGGGGDLKTELNQLCFWVDLEFGAATNLPKVSLQYHAQERDYRVNLKEEVNLCDPTS